MAKYQEALTPVGTFLFPKLTPGDPDIYNPPNGGEVRKYKTAIKFDSRDELANFEQLCDDTLTKYMQENNYDPEQWEVKPVVLPNSYERDGEVITDGFIINVDMKANYQKGGKLIETTPKRFGPDAKPLADDVEILGGSTGRAHVGIKPYCYDDKGFVGVRLMLYAVQVEELYSGASKFDALVETEENVFDEV